MNQGRSDFGLHGNDYVEFYNNLILSIFEITLNISLMNKNILDPVYYIILILLTCSFVIYQAFKFSQYVFFVNIKAENGLIDLSRTSLDEKIIPLSGEYEFC